MSMKPMMRLADFVRDLEGLPHWPAVLRAISATEGKSCARRSDWVGQPGAKCNVTKRSWHHKTIVQQGECLHMSPYTCNGLRGGNTIFAPVIGAASLHILHQLHDQAECLNLITTRERATGRRYDRVLWSRLEFIWLLPHPPLSVLDDGCTWIPHGEDYAGINDRHALLTRDAANTYLGRYTIILDGRVMNVSLSLKAGRFNHMSEEKFLFQAFASQHLPICKFPAAAYLGCCTATHMKRKSFLGSCNSKRCHARVLPSSLESLALPLGAKLSKDSSVLRLIKRTGSRLQKQYISGKYYEEIELALKHTVAKFLPGSTYSKQSTKFAKTEMVVAASLALKSQWRAQVRQMWEVGTVGDYWPTKGLKRKAFGIAWTATEAAAASPPLSVVAASQPLPRASNGCDRSLLQRYEPSDLERRWSTAVAEAGALNCKPWLPPSGVLRTLARETVTAAAQPSAHSHLVFAPTTSACGGEANQPSAREPIEPLVSFLRSPQALATDNDDPNHAMFVKDWLVLPSPSYIQSVKRAGGRFIFLDLGAGLYSTGGRTPGAVNGSSLKWFSWRYGQIGAEFERIIAFEARAFKPTKLWDSMPPWIMSKLQYFNVPAAAEAGAKLNPWRILEGIASERDYVVVKLDIDHAATELALVHQLLDDRNGVARLVDELFWEHHVAGSALCCPKLWRWREPTGLGWARMSFNRSNADETLAGSYALLHQLRSRGIRAHSWV